MFIIISLIALPLCFFLAKEKGFNPWLWLFASSVLGLVILLISPSALKKDLDDKEIKLRQKSGNIMGGILTFIGLSFAAFSILMEMK